MCGKSKRKESWKKLEEKSTLPVEEQRQELYSQFSSESMQTGREGSEFLKCYEEKL